MFTQLALSEHIVVRPPQSHRSRAIFAELSGRWHISRALRVVRRALITHAGYDKTVQNAPKESGETDADAPSPCREVRREPKAPLKRDGRQARPS